MNGAAGDDRKQRGNSAEDRAATELARHGYEIVERNYRCKLGELDIVARDGDTLVFVEVRLRHTADRGTALAAVTRRKQRQVVKVARAYLHHRKPRFERCRFDVIGITAGQLTHIKSAFRA